MLRKFQAKLEKELESCKKCMVDNKLSLQLGKTETMLVGSTKKKRESETNSVTCNNQEIEGVKSVNYLGVNLDQSATGEYMVQSVLKKVNGKLIFFCIQARFLDQYI